MAYYKTDYRQVAIEYPYHLCPVCGMQSGSTSRVCSKHISVTYDAQGNVLRYTDWNWASDTYKFVPGDTPSLPVANNKNYVAQHSKH